MNDVKLTVLGGEGTGKSGKCVCFFFFFFSGVEYIKSEKYIDILYIYINIL